MTEGQDVKGDRPHNPQDAFAQVVDHARALGFEYCAYGLQVPWPLTRPHTHMFSNYPKAWRARYAEQQYLRIDPTVHHARTSLAPAIWSHRLFAHTPALWQEAQDVGLRIGWVQGVRDVGHNGMLTLARSAEPLSAAELREKAPQVLWLAHAAHDTMSRLLPSVIAIEGPASLTERETEILRWTGDGKSAGEIATILEISERTVHFHIQNVMAKLGAVNKTAAVAQAVALGLLIDGVSGASARDRAAGTRATSSSSGTNEDPPLGATPVRPTSLP